MGEARSWTVRGLRRGGLPGVRGLEGDSIVSRRWDTQARVHGNDGDKGNIKFPLI